ncbi:hypothetical protein BVRB_5g116170 [Beta vulgaris subsp. vulgaris]|nr:hypothetical protein BVRB_5g116170 [Beta vulgaris subsp. vulgaris]
MLSYYKVAVVAFFMLTASAMAMTGAKIQPITSTQTVSNGLLEAEIKALTALKQVEKAISSDLKQKLMGEEECAPSGHICSGFGPPEQCCSGACVPHPMLRIFVCA